MATTLSGAMYLLLYPSHAKATILYFDTMEKAYGYCVNYLKSLHQLPEYPLQFVKDTLDLYEISPVANIVLQNKTGLQLCIFNKPIEYIKKTYNIYDAIVW